MKLYISILFFFIAEISYGQMSSETVAELSKRSVVHIIAYDSYGYEKGQGSGVVIGATGNQSIIITNYHVYKEGWISVKIGSEPYYSNQILTYNVSKDYLIFKIDRSLPAIRIGDSDFVKEASVVYALGSPIGLNGTITNGIVSALRNDFLYNGIKQKFIQHNAAISPGSSGGALLNSYGELIGINVFLYDRGQNLNFAIPINEILNEIKYLEWAKLIISGQNNFNDCFYSPNQINPMPDDWWNQDGRYEYRNGGVFVKQRFNGDNFLILEDFGRGNSGRGIFVEPRYNNNQSYYSYEQDENGSKSGWEKFKQGFDTGVYIIDEVTKRIFPRYPNQNYRYTLPHNQNFANPNSPSTPQYGPRDRKPIMWNTLPR